MDAVLNTKYNITAITAAKAGHRNHVDTIFCSVPISVGAPVKIFQPIIAPTIACEVETGIFARVIQKTVKPADRATINAPAIAFTEPSIPSV